MTTAEANPFLSGAVIEAPEVDTDVNEAEARNGRRRGITITKVERDDAGHWHARVTPAGGETIDVDRIHGSWQTSASPRREVLPHIAAMLQSKVSPTENAERRAREAAAEAAKAAAEKTTSNQNQKED